MKSQSKVWSMPQLTVHGGVAQVTEAKPQKLKSPGTKDDFGVAGVS
jgi:hypothetical protein